MNNANLSLGRQEKKRRSCRWDDIEEEDEDLVYKQATTTKESVAGTTTNKRRTVDWIDDAGLSLELADEEEERRLDRRAGGSLELPANNLLKEKEWDP